MYCLGGARADLKLEWLRKIRVAFPSEQEKESIQIKSKELEEAFEVYLKKLAELI